MEYDPIEFREAVKEATQEVLGAVKRKVAPGLAATLSPYKKGGVVKNGQMPYSLRFSARGNAGQKVRVTARPKFPFRSHSLYATDNHGGNATDIDQMYIRGRIQFPFAPHPSRIFNGKEQLLVDDAPPSSDITIVVSFKKDGEWKATLSGTAYVGDYYAPGKEYVRGTDEQNQRRTAMEYDPIEFREAVKEATQEVLGAQAETAVGAVDEEIVGVADEEIVGPTDDNFTGGFTSALSVLAPAAAGWWLGGPLVGVIGAGVGYWLSHRGGDTVLGAKRLCGCVICRTMRKISGKGAY